MYDFSATGPGTFTFDPVPTFQVSGLNDVVETISDTVRLNITNTGSVSITVTDDVSKRSLNLEKRAEVVCSNSTQASFISVSYTEGKYLAALSSSYITTRGANDSVYKAYYGTNPISSVISKFDAVANENSTSRLLSCTDPNTCATGIIAYTDLSTTNIYYCDIFYNYLPSDSLCNNGSTVNDRKVRGSIALHELTHAVADTTDVTYGCPSNQALTDSYKVINADSYNVST